MQKRKRGRYASFPYRVFSAAFVATIISSSCFPIVDTLINPTKVYAEETNPVLPGDYYRDKNGSSYWATSNIREWLNSNQAHVTYTNKAPSFDVLNKNAYDQEMGFLANFTPEEQDAIAVTQRRSFLNGNDALVREGGSYGLGYSYIGTPFIDYYFNGIQQNWKNYFYQNVNEKVFLLSPQELYYYVQKRGISLKKEPTERVRQKYNISSPYVSWVMSVGFSSQFEESVLAVDGNGYIGRVSPSSLMGIVPALHLKPDYVLQNGKKAKDLQIGETVYFGRYDGSPIEWIVINKTPEGYPLLWSIKVITMKPYDAPGDASYKNSNVVQFPNYDVSISNDLKVYYPNGDSVSPRLYVVNKQDLDVRKNGGWDLELQATDAESGVEAIILPDGTKVYGDHVTYHVTENKTYYFQAVDKAGNYVNLSIPVGNINPPSSVVINTSANGWTNQDVKVDIFASNDVGGFQKDLVVATGRDTYGPVWSNYTTYAGKRIRVTGKVKMTQALADPGNISVGIGFRMLYRYPVGDGYHITYRWDTPVRFYLKDINNVEKSFDFIYTVPGDFYRDLTPFFQIGHPFYDNGKYRVEWTDVKYELLDTDDFKIQKIILPNGQEVYSNSYTDILTQEGDYTYKVVDNRGMITEKTVSVKIDKDAPTLTISGNPAQKTNQDAILHVEARDSLSGIRRIQKPNGEWVNASSLDYTVFQNGTYTFKAEDNAGNITTQSVTVTNIDQTPPLPATFQPSTTSPTNKDVTVAVQFPSDAVVKEVRVNNEEWQPYTHPIIFTSNGTIEARSMDDVGNVSLVSSYQVNNIDKTPPTSPVLSADKTSPTNKDVVVTISYPTDAVIKEYRINGGAWQTYSTPIVMDANGKIEARAVDQAGNVSDIVSYDVTNIDKIPPAEATFTPSTTAPTNQDVTVSIHYPDDAIVKEYKVGESGTWRPYTDSIVLSSNNTVYARSYDAAGNVSSESSYTVNNIDKVAPNTPIINENITTPTNSDVVITIDYPSDAIVKEYRINGGEWSAYTGALTISSNGTVEARAIDEAGNISPISSYHVNNIDKSAPAVPSIQVYPDKITFTPGKDDEGDSYVLYRIYQGKWVKYESPLILPDGNYDVEAKTVDRAGNESQIVRIDVILYGEQLARAQQAINNAVSLKTQSAVDDAFKEINDLPDNVPEKDLLLEQLEQLQIEVAEKLVNEVSKDPTLENVEKANQSVAKVKEVSLKTQWKNQLKVIENLLNGSGDIYEGMLMSREAYLALKAIERAEKYTVSSMVKYAYKKFDVVPEDDFYKEILRKRLQQLQAKYDDILAHQKQSYELKRTVLQVKALEKAYSPTLLRLAQEAVNVLPDGDDKDILQERINNVISLVQSSIKAKKVKEAEDAVANAEKYKTDYYIKKATELVSQLPDGQNKQALQQRLDALKQTPSEDEIAYQKALDAVKLANKYKISYYYKKAMEAINLVKDENKKQELLQLLQSSNS